MEKAYIEKNGLTFTEHEFLIYKLHELIVGGDITCVIITLPVTAGGITYLIMLWVFSWFLV